MYSRLDLKDVLVELPGVTYQVFSKVYLQAMLRHKSAYANFISREPVILYTPQYNQTHSCVVAISN